MKSLTLAHLTIGAAPELTVDAAAAAQFGAVGLRICGRRPGDPFATPLVGHPAAASALRRRAEDQGVRISNVSAYQFYPEVTWDDIAPVIETTVLLGAGIVVVNGFHPDEAAFVQIFSRYCAAAKDAGLRVALEFLPYSAVRNLNAALRIVEASGSPSAGLLLDALHLERSGGSPSDLTAIDPARIVFAQLCDAMRSQRPRSDEALMHEARLARLPAGEGELPLYDFLDALPTGLEIEYEVARKDLSERTPVDKALAAHEDAQRFMSAYATARAQGRLPEGQRP